MYTNNMAKKSKPQISLSIKRLKLMAQDFLWEKLPVKESDKEIVVSRFLSYIQDHKNDKL